MSDFFLVKVSADGKRTEIKSSFESDILIATAKDLTRKNPGQLFAVIDEFDAFIWPNDI